MALSLGQEHFADFHGSLVHLFKESSVKRIIVLKEKRDQTANGQRTWQSASLENVLQCLDVGRLLIQLSNQSLHSFVNLFNRDFKRVEFLLQKKILRRDPSSFFLLREVGPKLSFSQEGA